MSSQLTLQEWTNPPSGRFDEVAWASIVAASEISALSIALNCSRRGDAKSLSALCQHLENVGPGYLLAEGQAPTLQDMMPQYADVSPADWGDPSKAKQPLKASQRSWDDCSLENIIAWCLARPTTADGRHIAPQTEREDRGDVQQGYLPPYKDDLSSAQHRLLQSAMSLFATIPATTQKPSGIARLCAAVTGHVAWPGVYQAFLDAGHSSEEMLTAQAAGGARMDRTSHTPAVYAMLLGNPVGALAIDSAPDHPNAASLRNDWMYGNVVQKEGPKDALTLDKTISLLRKSVGDEHLEHEPRFVALAELMNRTSTADSDVATVQRSLMCVVKHLDWLGNKDRGAMWCEPFAQAMVRPLREMLRDDLVEALSDLQQVPAMVGTKGNLARDLVRGVLQSSCAPVIEALTPALPLVMSCDFWTGDETFGGWTVLSNHKSMGSWDSARGPQAWKATLSILKDAGLDPTQHLYEGDHSPESQEERSRHVSNGNVQAANEISSAPLHKHSTLMHLAAEGPDPIPKMLALVEMGADPSAYDHVVKTPSKRIKDPDVRERWDSILRSAKARASAQDVLDELFADEPPTSTKTSITKGP